MRKFLKTNRYAVTEDGEIIDKESLLVLYDKQRRQNIERMIAKCGLKAGTIIETHIFRNFNFATGKSSLQSGTERQLEEIAAALRQIKPSLIKIHGHTDMQRFSGKSQKESDLLNCKLSEKRAETIAQSLAQLGIPRTNMEIKGFGHSKPAAGYSKWELAKNRRVEIEVE